MYFILLDKDYGVDNYMVQYDESFVLDQFKAWKINSV